MNETVILILKVLLYFILNGIGLILIKTFTFSQHGNSAENTIFEYSKVKSNFILFIGIAVISFSLFQLFEIEWPIFLFISLFNAGKIVKYWDSLYKYRIGDFLNIYAFYKVSNKYPKETDLLKVTTKSYLRNRVNKELSEKIFFDVFIMFPSASQDGRERTLRKILIAEDDFVYKTFTKKGHISYELKMVERIDNCIETEIEIHRKNYDFSKLKSMWQSFKWRKAFWAFKIILFQLALVFLIFILKAKIF